MGTRGPENFSSDGAQELAEDEILLLELGSLRGNVKDDLPDQVLVNHLLDTMRPAGE